MSKLRRSLSLARARARKHPRSGKYLEQYLRAKSRLGIFDSRMNRTFNVPLARVHPRVKAFLARGYAYGLVPTATTNGTHSAASLHYSGNAGDLGVKPSLIGTREAQERMLRFQGAEFRAWLKGRRGAMLELIGPDNGEVVLRGAHSPLAEGSALEQQHDNHVHGGFRL
jgi:hypothetical protein